MQGTSDSQRIPLTRRGFVKGGGALFVSLCLPTACTTRHTATETSAVPTRLASWLEIRSDNTVLVRTGRTETGTGMSGYYTQAVAEELNIRPQAISLLMGDTDQTPDGGYSAGFLYGMSNVRKVAALTYQALLSLAATELGLPASQLSVVDGVVTGGTRQITFGQLVQNRHLELEIPVTGRLPKADSAAWVGINSLDGMSVAADPPLKPMKDFKVLGTSFPVPGIPDKVTGKTRWSCDIHLPGMLHARMVRPATLGSRLISAGKVDPTLFPTAAVVTRNNLVAVVSPDEWEAINAAQSVAAATRWSDWAGLPGSANLTRTLRAFPWGTPESKGQDAAGLNTAFESATQKLAASYEQPYVRHAPIGPFLAVADARADGSVTVWTHSAQSQGLRARLAHMAGVPVEKVVVRWLEHSGQYGRTTLGGDGAEADAVILSQLTGKPVRVQWTLQEDLAWSTASPGWVADIRACLDQSRRLTAVHSAFYSPHMFDPRPVGALLAGMPCNTSKPGGWIATEWPYDKIPHRLEQAFGMPNLGAGCPSGGLRGHIMRTPGQRQQNFVLESLMNEAAAAARADPVEFRIQHTSDQRLVDLLNATARAARWEPRPAPLQVATRGGSNTLRGRGVCIIVRQNAYWAGIAAVEVDLKTGVVTVPHFTIGADCGKIINPRQLDRCMKSGVVMGLSEALKEEVTFDTGKVTSTDWSRYKILTMAEMPDIQVVQISRDDHGFGGGSEAANAVVPAAVAAAFFDATGIPARRIPLTPGYVTTLLSEVY